MNLGSQMQHDNRNAVSTSTPEPTEPNPLRLVRLPFELRHLISEYLITDSGWEGLDLASLSRLARACKAFYLAFQPILYTNLALRHIDMTSQKHDPQSNTVYGALINCLVNTPALAACVRSLDFTFIPRVYKESLPDTHHQLITQHVERFATGRGPLSLKYNLPDIRGPEGYPAQITVLLLVTRERLRKARVSVPWFLWTEDAKGSVSRHSRQIPGIILRESLAFEFPNLSHLALDYGESKELSVEFRRLKGSDCCIQGDSRLVLLGAPNLKVLILRECKLAKLKPCIPATVTSLTLQDCYSGCRCRFMQENGQRGQIEGFSDVNLSLKSLTITFGKLAVACNNPGNIPYHFRCYPDGTTGPLAAPRPTWFGPTQVTNNRHSAVGDHPPHLTKWHDRRSMASDAAMAGRTLAAVAASPSAMRETMEHVTIDLGFLELLTTTMMVRFHPKKIQYPVGYIAWYGRRFFRPDPGGRILMGIPLFTNIKVLTVNCAFIMLAYDSRLTHHMQNRGVNNDVLVDLTRGCRSTLETLQLTGVNLVFRNLAITLKTFANHRASDPTPDRPLKRVTLFSDGPANKEVANLVSETYASPLRQRGVELALLVSGLWEKGEDNRRNWAQREYLG